jgi:hypothetical protein
MCNAVTCSRLLVTSHSPQVAFELKYLPREGLKLNCRVFVWSLYIWPTKSRNMFKHFIHGHNFFLAKQRHSQILLYIHLSLRTHAPCPISMSTSEKLSLNNWFNGSWDWQSHDNRLAVDENADFQWKIFRFCETPYVLNLSIKSRNTLVFFKNIVSTHRP